MSDQPVGEPITDKWKYDPTYQRTMDFLGVDRYERDDFEIAKRTAYLYDWAAEKAKSDDPSAVLQTLRDYKKSLGTQLQGKSLILELFRNARLDQDSQVKKMPRAEEVRAKEQPKVVAKPKPKVAKPAGIKGEIEKAIQSQVGQVIQKSLSDKKFISKTISNSVQQVLNEH